MTEFLTGRYEGFDIDKSGIEWCQSEYRDAPNFAFHHADVFNARYNKTGQVAAKDFRFPFDDNRICLKMMLPITFPKLHVF